MTDRSDQADGVGEPLVTPQAGPSDDGLILPPVVSSADEGENEKVMSLVEHLSELRLRLLVSIGAIVAAAVVTLYHASTITRLVVRTAPGVEFIALTPMEIFFTEFKIGVISAVILVIPVITWQMWAFIRPGLKHGELAALRFIAPTASLLFVVGGSFAFLIVVPIGVKFLSSFAMDGVKSQYSLASYTSFVLFLVLAMGLLFECPLVFMLLARLGLVTKKSLAGRRRHIILGCFVIAAVVTPTPDMITQSLVALPMWLLFEGTLFFMKGTEP